MTSRSTETTSLSSHNIAHMMLLLTTKQIEGGGGHVTDILTPVHTSPEGFENGGFTLKTHQMFPIHTMLKEF